MKKEDDAGNVYYYIEKSLQLQDNAKVRLLPQVPILMGVTFWTITVEYRRRNRGDRTSFSVALFANEWLYLRDVLNGDNLRGGKVTLTWTWLFLVLGKPYGVSSGAPTIFYIRGKNPTPDEVKAEIGDTPWIAKPIAKTESNYYLQFNTVGTLGPGWEDYRDCPNRNPKRYAWGIMQLYKPEPAAHHLWNWKTNIAEGKRRIVTKYTGYHMANWWISRQEEQQREDDPNKPLENETFSFGSRRQIHFRKGTSRTPEDACAIQAYEGAALWVIYWDRPTKTWKIRDTHRSYVDRVCDNIE